MKIESNHHATGQATALTVLRMVALSLALCWLSGCAENPGTWGKEKVEAKIIEKLELDSVSLTKNDAGYSGDGTRGEETITVTITQDAAAHRMSWDATGDRGFVEEGFFELK